MKTAFLLLFFQFVFYTAFTQQVAIGADKNNVFYAGIDNPLTITAENCPCKSLVVKVDNGKINGSGCKLAYNGNTPGIATITVYQRTADKLKKLGSNNFMVKLIPPPSFKIGPYGSSRRAQKALIAGQSAVRANLNGFFGYDVMFTIDSFRVSILLKDSCKTKTYFNKTNTINDELRAAFSVLAAGDIIIFDKIFARGPGGSIELDPLVLMIEN
ncbi:GldM family protein [Ferruginibacter sp. SUN106]|uniref:GldM family protein n=1 Tax=Ferruginibacter sp. SUN106 TaxID=2978348 RepID=UPI003D364C7B